MLRRMGTGNEGRDMRPVLWEQAFRDRGVMSAFALAKKLARRRRPVQAAEAEDAAFELHDAEYRRLCAANRVELEAGKAVRSRAKRRRG
jgi:hypothetical protein